MTRTALYFGGILFLAESLIHPPAPAHAQTVSYFNDEAAWVAAVVAQGATVQTLQTWPDVVALADEVAANPGTNTALGPQLTFSAANSGLSLDFQLRAINALPACAARALVYDDNEAGLPIGLRLISIGDIDGVPSCAGSDVSYQDDDFEVTWTAASGEVFAFGISVHGAGAEPGESLQVYGAGDVLLATFTAGLPNNGNFSVDVFMGVSSDVPITRILFEESSAGGDDIAVRDPRFGVTCAPGPVLTVFANELDWTAEVGALAGSVESFDTTPANVGLADEIATPPLTNQALGPQLTFGSAATGLSVDFALSAVNVVAACADRALVYDDNEADMPIGQRIISIGDIDGVPGCTGSDVSYQNDDFGVSWTSADEVFAVGLTIVGSAIQGAGEKIEVYGEGDVLLETVTCCLPSLNSFQFGFFVGLVASEPITRIAYNELLDADDLGIRDLRFGLMESVGSIAGRVVADCPSPESGLLGVVIDAFEVGTGDLVASDTTNTSGEYLMPSVGAGNYTATIVRPLGYGIASDDIAVTVVGGSTATADFALTCMTVASNPRGSGYWKHQVGAATGGRGNAQVDGATLCTYLDVIEDHFNNNAINEVAVYLPPASDLCPDKLDAVKDLLNLRGNVGTLARAKQQLVTLLMNVAAQHIGLTEVISDDGATVSQAITFCDNLIDDAAGDHNTAKSVAATINGGGIVEAGVITLGTPDIAYAKPQFADLPLRVSPNPGGGQAYTFSFGMPLSGPATLEVYNVAGRRITTIQSAYLEAGQPRISWVGRNANGGRIGRGVYFARLTTPEGTNTVKFIHLSR